MTTDQSRDERMDDLLRRAGEQWRTGHDAATDLGRIGVPTSDGPTSGGFLHDAPPVVGRRTIGRRGQVAGVAVVAATVAAIVVGTVSIVGGTRGATPEPTSAATAPLTTAAPVTATATDLVGTSWALAEATSEGAPVALPSTAKDLPLRFEAGTGGGTDDVDISVSDGCNYHGGTVSITATTLDVALGYTTLAACPSIDLVTAVLFGTVSWSVTGDVLTIDHEGVGTLTYRSVPGIDPGQPGSPSGTPPAADPSPSGS